MSNSMTFIATGDSFITRRLPSPVTSSFLELFSLMTEAEVRFTNLETTIHNFEGFPSAISGGTWAVAPPEVLRDLKSFGFNIVAWANNHTLDYSYGGLSATTKYLNLYEFVHAGVGQNLAEASAPRYIDCPSGRVALIAVTSGFHECWVAGEQRPDMIGRPGVNPLRVSKTYLLPRDQLEQLKSIARVVPIKGMIQPPSLESKEELFYFGDYSFRESQEIGITTHPVERDVIRIRKSISEALRQADYVLVSVHSHETNNSNIFQPADFLKVFARGCIDAGAHAVIGHGPHLLQGIEIYQSRPIFYSLGNFIFQTETVSLLPADFYEQYGLDHSSSVADALDKRSNKDTIGPGKIPYVWESIIPFWKMENGRLKELKIYPIELGFGLSRYRRGWPVLSKKVQLLEHLKEISKPYGTCIEINGSVGKVVLD